MTQLVKCSDDPKQMVTLKRDTCRAWKPTQLPWVAKCTGVEGYVWYTIHNSYGDEVFSTGKVSNADKDQALYEVLLLLSSVNSSDEVRIDDTMTKIQWI
ncbi:hypothetical protein UFOVP558_40 [uncultured Caudovirales phage]|uniref:Uncharacterized protein n=1 Tax=uncultured Caudovirales phage TaxID=2100421 RepID=A0A6J5MV47_9CAUD|nr:hypothetical protein UFOVP558_40 [uncultured Caudovirales phage]